MSAVPPAGAGAPLPTPEEIENWPTSHLSDGAEAWRKAATESNAAFDQHRRNVAAPGGTDWDGTAKDTALDLVTADVRVAGYHGEELTKAATIAEDGITGITAAKREAVAALKAARDDGFTVGADLSVTDARRYDINTVLDRNRAATEHATDIRWYAERLLQADDFVGKQLVKQAAELQAIRFEGEGDGNGAHVQLVDRHFKLDPQDTTREPKRPHDTDPNRASDGTYGPNNQGDGKAAERAALDAREQETGIPIIRQQVRATHPDVVNPDTGKLQNRYYDGLQPTGNPDEYIGFEAKTNKESLDPKQKKFDAAVTPEKPARAMLNGREIKIVDSQVIYPPKGWVPPPVEMGPGAGASAGTVTAGPVPNPTVDWGGAEAEGTVSAGPATGSAPVTPSWGTHLTPQQMIDSDDPFLRVAGQEIRRRMAEQGIVDPSGIA